MSSEPVDLFPLFPTPPDPTPPDQGHRHSTPRPKKRPPNIQDSFLFAHLKEGQRLAFALANGKALAGRIKRFDRYTVLIESRGQETLVYKHAIVAITAPPSPT